MRVRLLTALCFGGRRAEAGTVIDLPDHTAREAINRRVAERVDPAQSVSGPMTTESAAEIVTGKRRGAKNAVQ